MHGRLTIDEAQALPEVTTAAERLALWQAGVGGTDWLHALVDANRAIMTAVNGYPSIYYALAADVIPQLEAPPHANATWHFDVGDIIDPHWVGRGPEVDASAAAACAPNEWLLVQVWDES
ncbi:hypothetical protein GCM10022399_42360 [Terrabacter ginsenosidimutans]|uniref:Uncharacterized protein n=1 Tax=Terrabacter ginsenosidimutans TaxID=490575 RepID=A0ABP7EQF4_9MICO